MWQFYFALTLSFSSPSSSGRGPGKSCCLLRRVPSALLSPPHPLCWRSGSSLLLLLHLLSLLFSFLSSPTFSSAFSSCSLPPFSSFFYVSSSSSRYCQPFRDKISRSVMSYSLWPHESQHARPPCPPPTPGVHSDSCPSSQWCHPAISSSVVPFSSCPQSLPANCFHELTCATFIKTLLWKYFCNSILEVENWRLRKTRNLPKIRS